MREQVHFSLFSEDYGGDSPRIKRPKNFKTDSDKTPTTYSFRA
jgi:hypothetical protein